jgi:WS/DGAT/MGAT family acyltransferase
MFDARGTGMSRSHESLSHVDAAWLRMDGPTNVMVITSLLTFDKAPSFQEIEALYRDRVLAERRFRQRVVEPRLEAPYWEEVPRVDLAWHLHHVALPDPGGDEELVQLVSELGSMPLPREQPLWQTHLIDRYKGGAALVTRLHHCIGDGVALVNMLLGLTDEGQGMVVPEVGLLPPRPERLVDMVRLAAAQTTTLGRLLLLPSDPPSPLRGALGPRKRLVFSQPVPLADVKAIGKAVGGTVNDVLAGAFAGALRRYLAERGWSPDARELRAMVPMYVRGRSAKGELGNHFGLVFLQLPIAVADPVARVRATRERMEAIKGSPEAQVSIGVLSALGVAANEIEQIAIDLFTRKATVMVTNVAGPPGQLHLAGKPVTGMVSWAPVSGNLSLGVSLLSYAGTVRIGLKADVGLVPDPEHILAAFDAELDELRKLVRSATVPAQMAV